MVAIDQFLKELCPLNELSDFRTIFFSLFTDNHLMFGTFLCHTKIQIKFEFGSDPLIFPKVMVRGLTCRTISWIFSFPDFLSLSLLTDIHLIFGTLLCHTKIQLKFEFGFDPLIFPEVMANGLRKISRIISFPYFFSSLLTGIHLTFGTFLCHTTIQIKFEFGFDPLILPEVMALGLRKISRIISFPHFFFSVYRYSFNVLYIVLPY
jgi:hypothetical protein